MNMQSTPNLIIMLETESTEESNKSSTYFHHRDVFYSTEVKDNFVESEWSKLQ